MRFRPLRRTFQLSLLATAVMGLSACGSSEPTGDIESTVSAGGTLTFQGKPLKFHQVTVFPKNHRPAAGISDEEGKFVLGTNGVADGAVVGMHTVSITYVGPPDTNPEAGMNDFSPPPKPDVMIPKKYGKAETSDLTVEIPDNGNTEILIDLK